MKKFAVFDIDGTLIRWQLYHATADALARLGHIDPDAHAAVRKARMLWKRRVSGSGFKDYEIEVIKVYEQALAKIDKPALDKAIQLVFDEYKDQVYTYTRQLIDELKKKEYLLFAISGSQTEIVEKIAAHYGFDDSVGTTYEYAGGRFTGKKTVGSHYKDQALKNLVTKHRASFTSSIAVGDSRSDIDMLELVQMPIAFNPEKELFNHARHHGWKIVLERKNIVYELESSDGQYQLAKTNVG